MRPFSFVFVFVLVHRLFGVTWFLCIYKNGASSSRLVLLSCLLLLRFSRARDCCLALERLASGGWVRCARRD